MKRKTPSSPNPEKKISKYLFTNNPTEKDFYFASKTQKCAACSSQIPRLLSRCYPTASLSENHIFCHVCATNNCHLVFYTSPSVSFGTFHVILRHNVTLEKFLSYSDREGVTERIESTRCCFFGTRKQVPEDYMLCDGNEFILLSKEDPSIYDKQCSLSAKTLWETIIPEEYRAKIEGTLQAEKLHFFSTEPTLADCLSTGCVSSGMLAGLRNVLGYLWNFQASLPQITTAEIVCDVTGRFWFLPFVSSELVGNNLLVLEQLMQEVSGFDVENAGLRLILEEYESKRAILRNSSELMKTTESTIGLLQEELQHINQLRGKST